MRKLLPEYRRKENNLKLTDILNVSFDELETLFRTIESWRSVDNAEGLVLDEIGQEVGQLRKGTTDEVYRFLIKAKVLSNNSKGDVYSIVNVISTVLGLEPGEFEISEAYIKDSENVGMINIEQVPIHTMLESGLTIDEFIELIKATVAAGIGINRLELSGTFEFVEKLVTDSAEGFADVDMTTGGTLGAVFGEGGVI